MSARIYFEFSAKIIDDNEGHIFSSTRAFNENIDELEYPEIMNSFYLFINSIEEFSIDKDSYKDICKLLKMKDIKIKI